MGEGRIDHSEFYRNSIHHGKCHADDEVEGTDATWHRDCEAKSAHKRKEKRINQVQTIQERSCFYDSMTLSVMYGVPVELGVVYATLSHTSQAITQIVFGLGSYAYETLTGR